MRKLNKKAFTLIEILATVTILGVLSVVAMVSVNKIIQNAKETHYTNAEDQLELAGQSYVQQHRSALPKAVGQKVKIPMEKLVNTNYIEQIKDYSDNGCDMKNSYVQVFKYSQSDYSYVAYLDCPVYKSKEHLKEAAPNVVLKLKGNTMGSEDKKGDKQQLDIRINNPSDEGTIEKPAKLISYSYVIYKYDKEVKNSGSVALPNYDTRIDKTIDLTPYAPGKLKIVVTATNIYGLSTTETITSDFKDTTGPTCVIKPEDQAEKAWTTGDRKITVGCSDENGSGCKRAEFTKTFKDSMRYGIITIEDNEGNRTDCEVSVNKDVTKPTIKVIAYKRTASGGKGAKIKEVTSNNANPDQTLDLTTINTTNWLNKASHPDGVYYEVVYSDESSTIVYTTKENPCGLIKTDANVNTMSLVETAQTAYSKATSNGTKTTRNYETRIDGHRIYTLEATDEIGNKNSLKIIAPLDREEPSVVTITNPSNEVWVNADFPLTLKSKDTLSGIKNFQYTFKNGATSITNKESTGYVEYANSSSTQNEDKTFVTPNYTTEGNNTSYIRACDNAGNCSSLSTTKIKLDKTKPAKPTLDISGTSTLTVKMTSSDKHSGIAYFDRRKANTSNAFTAFDEKGKTSITIKTSETIEIRAVDAAGNVSDSTFTKHCNISGGTLKFENNNWICVRDVIQVKHTCYDEWWENYCCSNGWQCTKSCWRVCASYCSRKHKDAYDCWKDGCVEGFTLNGNRCIKTADGG